MDAYKQFQQNRVDFLEKYNADYIFLGMKILCVLLILFAMYQIFRYLDEQRVFRRTVKNFYSGMKNLADEKRADEHDNELLYGQMAKTDFFSKLDNVLSNIQSSRRLL